jgi:hypothetical protein
MVSGLSLRDRRPGRDGLLFPLRTVSDRGRFTDTTNSVSTSVPDASATVVVTL